MSTFLPLGVNCQESDKICRWRRSLLIRNTIIERRNLMGVRMDQPCPDEQQETQKIETCDCGPIRSWRAVSIPTPKINVPAGLDAPTDWLFEVNPRRTYANAKVQPATATAPATARNFEGVLLALIAQPNAVINPNAPPNTMMILTGLARTIRPALYSRSINRFARTE